MAKNQFPERERGRICSRITRAIKITSLIQGQRKAQSAAASQLRHDKKIKKEYSEQQINRLDKQAGSLLESS